MKFQAKHRQDGEYHIIEIPAQGVLAVKLAVHEDSYAKAHERACEMLEEMTLTKEPELQFLLIE